ncbi:MAG: ABC transporter substrate-binding protein [Candidatus Nitrosopelagicus sp.]|jgi:NitT/TauT family transport system substrate-binding protein|nr:ABC transporter substrate-binding protein [Candidatus Nitrosopelagicus sp.]MDP6898611.1 ABC transporter substrate-binding protein [Candidatus Nitrosopelagicus sp.]|tara:strand:+ start:33 stop:1064 length:1032 start_codon:yes stop_codon:yes gene_type:complete
MKIPYLVGIAIVVIGVIVLVGTTQSSFDDSEKKIRIAFFPSIIHAVPIVGMENQTFSENLDTDLDIQVKIFDSGPQVIESIFSNSVDLAYVGPGPVINGYLKSDGKDLKILASAANGGASFVIQKNSGLESIENYPGKRIAAPQISNTQDVSLRHYLAENGLTSAEKGGDVFVLNISNPDIYTLFAKGDIDGAWVPEPWATMLVEELDGIRLFDENEFWPENKFSSVLLIGRADYIEKNPEIIKKWIDANEKTVKWINDNPTESKKLYNEFLKDYMGKTLPEKIVEESFSNIVITSEPVEKSIHIFAERADSLGYLGRDGYTLDEIFYHETISVTSNEDNNNG